MLDRPDLTATTREGYYVQTPPGLVNHDKPSNRLAFDLISAGTSRMVYDAVPLSLTAQPGTPNAFNIHVDPKALVWTLPYNGEPRGTQVILMVSLFDRKDNELFRDVKVIHVNATGDVPATGRLDRSLVLAYTLPRAVCGAGECYGENRFGGCTAERGDGGDAGEDTAACCTVIETIATGGAPRTAPAEACLTGRLCNPRT
jgi:hypothetical protein